MSTAQLLIAPGDADGTVASTAHNWPLPFGIGDRVVVTDHYSWCSQDVYGEVGEIVEINRYPLGIIEGGAIYSVRRPARVPIPLVARQIRHA